MTAAHVQTESRIADLPGQALGRTVADLQTTRPGPGLWRYFSSMAILFASLAVAYQHGLDSLLFYLAAMIAGIFFAAAAVTTHDAIHHTLTGIGWFDEISARVATWGVLWPHGIYSELHKLHHKMNGIDERDPERVTYTQQEYEQAGALKRFRIRHQLLIAVFLGGGIGMIMEHLSRASGFMKQSKGLRRQLVIDVVGIVAINGTLYALAAAQGQLAKALILYLIVERVGGGLLQLRAHVEHYGIAGKRANYFSTQIHACRNIETNTAMSWLFNGLNFHSIHHAFPKVPFYHLEEAHNRMTNLLDNENAQPMPQSKGYIRTFVGLTRELKLINTSQYQ
ncbi:MAG: fatty acid desaturase [Betaproteobacteria bacterium]|nr:fatty acid desaturase [Betaproteobacteria bacterium]